MTCSISKLDIFFASTSPQAIHTCQTRLAHELSGRPCSNRNQVNVQRVPTLVISDHPLCLAQSTKMSRIDFWNEYGTWSSICWTVETFGSYTTTQRLTCPTISSNLSPKGRLCASINQPNLQICPILCPSTPFLIQLLKLKMKGR